MKKFWKIFPIQFGFLMIPLGLLWLFFIVTLIDGAPRLIPSNDTSTVIIGHAVTNALIGGLSVWWLNKFYTRKKIKDSTRKYLILTQIIWTALTLLPLILILRAEITGMGLLG